MLFCISSSSFLSPPPSSAHQPTHRLTWNTSEAMDSASSSGRSSSRRLFPDNDRALLREDLSSQSSSVTTTMTLGLSPSSSPQTSLDHENFHSLVQMPSTPSQTSGRSSFDDYSEGLVMKVPRGRGSDCSNGGGTGGGNGSVEDDFQMGFYRARSNHVAAVRRPSSDLQARGYEHSSHEQLHCPSSATSTAATAGGNGNGFRQNRTSDSSGSALETDQDKEQWLEVGAEEVENRSHEPSSAPLQVRSSEPSLTPTPPTSYLDQKYSRICAGSNCADKAVNLDDEYMICELNSGQDAARSASTPADDEYATVFAKPSPSSVPPTEEYLNKDSVTRCQLYV